MTSKIYSAVLAGTAVLAIAMGSTSAHAATATADARARVLSALTLTNNTALEFGAVVAALTPGQVTINNAGTRSACTGGISCSGVVSAAEFDVTGSASEIVDVDIDASVVLVSGTNSMTADLDDDFSLTLSTTGTATFAVGGTLDVAASQPEGVYEAEFDVTAEYQ